MTQEELAELIGTNQRQISKYENGYNDPTADVLAGLARALDTTSDWLLGLTDVAERPLRTEMDLNEDERELIKLYRSKPTEKRRQAIEVLKVI